MGRKDAYFYYSEASQAQVTPGSPEKTLESDIGRTCVSCSEEKESATERAGRFDGEVLCADCVEEKAAEEDNRRAKSVLQQIRGT